MLTTFITDEIRDSKNTTDDCIREIQKLDDINQRDQYGSTALMVCGKFGTHECKRLDVDVI